MQLIYKIEFNTTNLYFKYIIEDLIKEAKINNILIPDIVKSMIGSYNGEHLNRIPNEEDFTHAINL